MLERHWRPVPMAPIRTRSLAPSTLRLRGPASDRLTAAPAPVARFTKPLRSMDEVIGDPPRRAPYRRGTRRSTEGRDKTTPAVAPIHGRRRVRASDLFALR